MTYQPDFKIRLRRGLLASLPTLNEGEPGFCTDSFDMYIGSSDGNKKFQPTVTLDSRYLLLTGSLADVSDHSHTVLTDIGSNTHSQVDTHLAGTLAAHASTTSAQLAGVISDETGSGSLVFSTTPTFTGLVTIIPSAAAVKGLIVKGVASQSANLQEWQNSIGTVLAYIDALGGLSMSRSTNSTTAYNFKNAAGTSVLNIDTTNQRVGIGTTGPGAKLDIAAGNLDLDSTTNANQFGVISKDGVRFIHNFNYGNNGMVTTDGYNTFVGVYAGNLTMGSTATQTYQASYNTALGFQALYSNTTGYNNTASGVQSLYSNTTGYYNTASGVQALFSNTTGYRNTASGMYALYSNTTGSYNTASGYNAGSYISGGVNPNQTSITSLYLGAETKALANGDSNEIVLGYNTTGFGSNTAAYGNSSLTKHIFQAGNVGIGTTTPTGKLEIGTYSASGTNAYSLYINSISGAANNYAIYTNAGLVHFGDSLDLASGKNITLVAANLITDTTTGTKIGTATNQKLSFYNSTPIVQPLATTDLGTVLSDLGLRATGTAYPITTSGAVQFTGGLTVSTVGVTITDVNFSLGTTTGTKIATATSQKLGFWNATPIVQPTTSISSAILICNEGTPITDLDTFDGYTLQKVVKALRNVGILA